MPLSDRLNAPNGNRDHLTARALQAELHGLQVWVFACPGDQSAAEAAPSDLECIVVRVGRIHCGQLRFGWRTGS